MHDIQGVSIGADDVYKVLKTKLDSGVEPVLDEDHPIVKLLTRISDLVMQTLGTTNLGKSTRIAKQASIFRIFTNTCKIGYHRRHIERKLIKTLSRPSFGRDGIDLTKSSIGWLAISDISCHANEHR
jgi:hypothetical protein